MHQLSAGDTWGNMLFLLQLAPVSHICGIEIQETSTGHHTNKKLLFNSSVPDWSKLCPTSTRLSWLDYEVRSGCFTGLARIEISRIIQISTTEMDELSVGCEVADSESSKAAFVNFERRNYVLLLRRAILTVEADIKRNTRMSYNASIRYTNINRSVKSKYRKQCIQHPHLNCSCHESECGAKSVLKSELSAYNCQFRQYLFYVDTECLLYNYLPTACRYYTPAQFSTKFSGTDRVNNLSVKHFSARSLKANLNKIKDTLRDLEYKFHIRSIAISETWFKENNWDGNEVSQFGVAFSSYKLYCNLRRKKQAWCCHICMRISAYISPNIFAFGTYRLMNVSEVFFIELQISKNTQINVGCNIYRAPNTSISKFNEKMSVKFFTCVVILT